MEEQKKKRFYAIGIDFLIGCFMIWFVEAVVSMIVPPAPHFLMFPMICGIHFFMYWLLCKDCYKGMSPGKRIMGIQIININTLNIAGSLRCIIRNLCFCFSFIEFIIFFSSPKGQRIGDILTSTKVVQRDNRLKQNLRPAVFIFATFFLIWILGVVIAYIRLRSLTLS